MNRLIFILLTVTSIALHPVFVVKPVYAVSEKQQWWNSIEGPGTDTASATAFDSSNNMIVFGDTYSQSVQFSTTSGKASTINLAAGSSASFLVKYSDTGVVQWTVRMTSQETDSTSICVDSQDNIYALLSYGSGDLMITDSSGSITIIPGDTEPDLFDSALVKFDGNGIFLWSVHLAGNDRDFVYSASRDSFDNVLISGYSSSSEMSVYQSDSSIAATFTNSNYYIGFLIKFSADGIYIWSIIQQDAYGCAVAIDSHDNIAHGFVSDGTTIDFLDPASNVQKTITGSDYGTTALIVNYNSDGQLLWQTSMSSSYDFAEIYDLCFDGDDKLVVMGEYNKAISISDSTDQIKAIVPSTNNDNAFLIKFSSSGEYQWSTYISVKSPNLIELRKISINALDNGIVITGAYYSTQINLLNKDGVSTTLATPKLRAGFAARYSATGDVLPFVRIVGNTLAFITAAVFDNNGNLGLIGTFDGTAPNPSLCTTSCVAISLSSRSVSSYDASFAIWLPSSTLIPKLIFVPQNSSSSLLSSATSSVGQVSSSKTSAGTTSTKVTTTSSKKSPSKATSTTTTAFYVAVETGSSNTTTLVYTVIGSLGVIGIVFAVALALYMTRGGNRNLPLGQNNNRAQVLGSNGSSYFLASTTKVNETKDSSRNELSRPKIEASRHMAQTPAATREPLYI